MTLTLVTVVRRLLSRWLVIGSWLLSVNSGVLLLVVDVLLARVLVLVGVIVLGEGRGGLLEEIHCGGMCLVKCEGLGVWLRKLGRCKKRGNRNLYNGEMREK